MAKQPSNRKNMTSTKMGSPIASGLTNKGGDYKQVSGGGKVSGKGSTIPSRASPKGRTRQDLYGGKNKA